jgi:hypothetical protein
MFANSYVYILLYKDSQPDKIDCFQSQIAKEDMLKRTLKPLSNFSLKITLCLTLSYTIKLGLTGVI